MRALLPRSRLVENTRTHYALVNSEQHVRHLILAGSGIAAMNHTSISTEVSSTDTSLATVHEVSGPVSYDKRLIKFHHRPGTVFLNAVSSSYKSDLFNHLLLGKKATTSYFGSQKATSKDPDSLITVVRDQMRIEVVTNLEVYPKYKSLFFLGRKNTQKFHLRNGSGHFAVVLNDTTLADVQHVDREVIIIPKRTGMLQIKVEDVEVPGSVPATADILLSDISSLHLESQGYLIEQGDALNMTVSAFDDRGVEFDLDQYEKMDFALETEMTGIHRTRGLVAERVQGEQ